MTVYFTTDPTARVSFWENQVEHIVTGVGLDIGDSGKADALVEQGLLRVGERTEDTLDANVYDPERDESLAYARSRSPEPTPEEIAELEASEAATAEAERQVVEEAAAAAAAAAEVAKVTPPTPTRSGKPTSPAAAEVQSASSSGDTPASQPTGPDAPQETST